MRTFTIPTIYTAVDRITGPLARMSAANQRFASSANSSMARLDRAMRPIGRTALRVGAAIAAPLALAVNEASKFETALASFRTIVSNLSNKEFAKFDDAIRGVGDATRQSYTAVAQNFEKIAGLNEKFAETAEGISMVSKASIILSQAARMELGPAAESLVGIMNQFSLGADQASRTINVLAAGQSAGAASIAQTAEAFVNFGSVAAGANISLEQSVALIQTLGKFSLFGAEAGTKLRGAVLRIQKAGIGYQSGQFKINDALLQARKRFDSLRTAKQKDSYLNKLFGAENIAAGRILLNNINLYDEFAKKVTGTNEATEQARINQATFAKRLEAVKNQVLNLAVRIGEKLLPVLSQILDKVTPVIKRMVDWARENPNTVRTIVQIASVVAALSFALWGLSGVIGLASKAFGALNFILNANPIVRLVILVALLAGWIYSLIKRTQGWGEQWSQITKFVKASWEVLYYSVKTIWLGMEHGFLNMVEAIVLAWKWGQNMIGQLSDEQYARDKARILKEKNDRVKAIQESAVAALRAASTVSEGIEWKLRMGDEKEAVNPKAAERQALAETIRTNNATLDVNIKDKGNNATVKGSGPFLHVKTSPTFGY